MEKKDVVIIGGGISGLAAAWHLLHKNPSVDCLVLEAGSICGGCIDDPFGPKVFQEARSRELLHLIEELGLMEQVLFADAGPRYLWHQGKMQQVGGLFLWPLFLALLSEWTKPVYVREETIWEFGCRRFGKRVAERLVDPFILGVYGGDCRELSMQACLPSLKAWESEHGSITRGMWSARKKKSSSRLISLGGGMRSLVEELIAQLPCPVVCGEKVWEIVPAAEGFFIRSRLREVWTDRIVLAVPAYEVARLVPVLGCLQEISYRKVICASVDLDVELPRGYGMLVGQKYGESVLGTLFDSSMFPQAYKRGHATVMLRGEADVSKGVHRALDMCLDRSFSVEMLRWKEMEIPQYRLGHVDLVQNARASLPKGLCIVGNYMDGVSVNHCIAAAAKAVDSLML